MDNLLLLFLLQILATDNLLLLLWCRSLADRLLFSASAALPIASHFIFCMINDEKDMIDRLIDDKSWTQITMW